MATKSLESNVDMEDVIRNLNLFGRRVEQAVAASLFQEAETVMARSKREFVPVFSGALKNSGHVQRPNISAGVVTVEMGFGGPSAPYALRIHEDMSIVHPSHEFGGLSYSCNGGAKYLERPFVESLKGLSERLAERLRKEALRD